jgi:tRNA pseudouridine(38-40) synthase
VSDEFQNKEVQSANKKLCMNREKIIQTVNEALCPHIKLFSIKMVSRSFDCKMQARSRHYEYLAPLSLFLKPESDMAATKETIQSLCARYIGTNKYHNFSHKLKYDDANATRVILDFTPEWIEFAGKPWVLFKIHG